MGDILELEALAKLLKQFMSQHYMIKGLKVEVKGDKFTLDLPHHEIEVRVK